MRYFYTISIMLTSMGLPVLASTPCPSKVSAPSQVRPSVLQTAVIKPPVKDAPVLATAMVNKLPCGMTSRFGHASSAIASALRTTALAAEAIAQATSRLARVTAYWACEGDYYTRHGISSTGVRLHDGHCAVDPNIIPYGSVVEVAGVGKFLAVDTGSAVISRTAARQGGHNSKERGAIVVDLYFASRKAGERFAANDAKYVAVSWWTPGSNDTQARAARSLFAEEDWGKIQSKQL